VLGLAVLILPPIVAVWHDAAILSAAGPHLADSDSARRDWPGLGRFGCEEPRCWPSLEIGDHGSLYILSVARTRKR
jgi:hypothetical protein